MTEPPLIGFNLIYARAEYTGGTVRYAVEILREVADQGGCRLVVFAQKGVFSTSHQLPATAKLLEYRIPGGLLGRVLFEHLVLPILASRNGVDLLFSPGFVSPLWGSFRKVVAIPDLYYRVYPAFVRPWQRRYWKVLVPLSLRRCDRAMVISESTMRDVSASFPWSAARLRKVHLGADAMGLTHLSPAEVGGEPYCLVVGNITPNKRIDTVLDAFALLADRGHHIRLKVIGVDHFGILRRRIERVGPDRVRLERSEHVDDAQLAALYAGALCLIQASQYEGFGLPVVEAMRMGCPVVATDIPVMHEVAGEAGLYFPVGDGSGLADQVLRLIDDESGRGAIVRASRAQAAKFQWSDTGRAVVKLFRETLAPDTSARLI